MRAAEGAWKVLDRADFANILIALGYATSAAFQNGDRDLGKSFLRLTNRLNLGNPDYTPYAEVEDGWDA